MDDSPRRARWPLAAAVPLTAAASLVLVLTATARANLGGPGDDPARPSGGVGDAAQGVDLAVPAMLPGRSAATCTIIPDDVLAGTSLRFFATASGDLAPHLDLSIRQGVPGATCADPGGTVPIYDGPLARLGLNGGAGVVVAFSQRVDRAPYVFEVSLPADTPNEAQGARATVGLRWEVMPVGAGR